MTIRQQTMEEVRPGLIIEYLQNNQPVPAWIIETQSSRVRVLNINQREVKLALSRILPWAGPGYSRDLSREEIITLLKEHNRKRHEEQERIRVLDVWEMSQGEIDQARVSWFAGLIWNEPDHDQTAALGRIMLQDRAHFKFSPPLFEVFSAEKVAVRLEQERIAREKERLVSVGRQLFKALWESGTKKVSLPEVEDLELLDKLKNLIVTRVRNPDDQETSDVWSKITTGLPREQNLAFILGSNWGIYPPHHNLLLEQADYEWGDSWTAGHLEQIREIRSKFQSQAREPLPKGFVSIDSETTRDIDDAFVLEPLDKSFLLTLALACPAMDWQVGSGLDKAVAHRTSSLYLPEGTSNMLPDILAEDLFSLVQNHPRPAMILRIELDEKAAVQGLDISLDWIMVESNLSYESVESLLESGTGGTLEDALRLAEILRKKRLESGAVIIEQSDPQVVLEGQDKEIKVNIKDNPPCPRAQLIVSEFMVLANSVLANWAVKKDVPLYYRTQDIALPMDYSGVWSKPEDIYQVVRSLGATLTETAPKPHRSIGVPCYAPATSPLRRYTDLINQLQILGFLQDRTPRLSKEEMDEMLPGLNARISLVTQVQRFRPRYWKLVYFKQNCKVRTWQGIVVDNNGPFVVLSLPRELVIVRAPFELFGGKTRLGQAFQLRLGKIDPLHNEISVLEAWEE